MSDVQKYCGGIKMHQLRRGTGRAGISDAGKHHTRASIKPMCQTSRKYQTHAHRDHTGQRYQTGEGIRRGEVSDARR